MITLYVTVAKASLVLKKRSCTATGCRLSGGLYDIKVNELPITSEIGSLDEWAHAGIPCLRSISRKAIWFAVLCIVCCREFHESFEKPQARKSMTVVNAASAALAFKRSQATRIQNLKILRPSFNCKSNRIQHHFRNDAEYSSWFGCN